MNKIFMFVSLLFAVLATQTICAQNNVTIKARFNNTTNERFYFDFMEEGSASMQFPYRDGREIEFDTELEDIAIMKINTFLLVVVQPGDVIEIDADYEGKGYRDVRFSGSSAESIAASEALNRIRNERLGRRYKTNIPAALAIQTPADVFYNTTLDEWNMELEILDEYKSKLSDKVYNFVRSELDAIFIPNIISYPGNNMMDGFWTALDNYVLRDDDASLRNSSYMGMLQVYMRYMMMKGAKESNEEFVQPASVEDEYNMIVNFYDGKLRDAALLVYLYGSLASGNDFDTVEKLVKDYTEKYNHNEKYLKMLTDVMK